MKTIKWGIIGAGGISSTFVTALNAIENTEVTAVASRNLGRAQGFAKRYHAKKAYGSYEELVADPEIDVIYIGTVNTEHKENAALCITHGKSVLCEKPFTINQEDTKYLIDLAKEHKVFLMEAMWTKFLPTTNIVKQWIKDKKIGEVKYFNISFGFQSEFDLKNRVYDPETAGGALLDVGIYPITYVVHMMDRLPDEISSSVHIGKSDVDEMNVIAFHYKEGIVADLSSAINAKIGMDALIVGDKGKIIVPNFWMASCASLYDENNKEVETFSLPHKTNGYEYEAEEVNRCIREGKLESDILPLSDTLGIICIMDKIRSDWGLKYPAEK